MDKILSEVKGRLEERDCRLTPQREAVLASLMEKAGNHPSVEEIYVATKKRYPDIGLATVYRTLELFESLGIVSKLEFGEAGSKYEFNPEMERHYHHHLICLGCGAIMEFNEDLLEDVERAVAGRTGFKITDHSLRFYGYCQNCVKTGRG
ncbi:MAG TPA: transcriptional repressor [Firmicutes bacterium]|nr:transcriptional repressor [Bacillota bacterium]